MPAIRRLLAVSAVLCIAAAVYGNSANAATTQPVCAVFAVKRMYVTHARGGFEVAHYRWRGVMRCVSVTAAVRAVIADQASPYGALLLRRYGIGGLRRLIEATDPGLPAWAVTAILYGIEIQA